MTTRTRPVCAPDAALVRALSVLLPDAGRTRFLRACLHSGAAGREAWRRCVELGPDPLVLFREDRRGVKGIAPVLLDRLRRNGVDVAPPLRTLLRTASLHEEMRARAYGRVRAKVLATLDAQGIPFIVLGGAALAETVYPDAALRHSHEVEILVRRPDHARAADALVDAGFRIRPERGVRARLEHTLEDASGLPIRLRSRLFHVQEYRTGWAALHPRSRVVDLAGCRAHVPAPADMLLHVCGHASYSPGRASLLWVCDAWMLVTRGSGPDWRGFTAAADHSGLALPLYVILRYLSRELGLPLPDDVVARLGHAAASAGATERDIALHHALRGNAGGTRRVLDQPDWVAKLRAARWLLLRRIRQSWRRRIRA